MIESKLTQIALNLMNKHGLITNGWTFEITKYKSHIGLCNDWSKTISIAKLYVEVLNKQLVKEVILHEIAHALVGCNEGHNKIWKAKAIEIGCSGSRVIYLPTIPDKKYIATCPTCNKKINRHNKMYLSCSDCDNKKFNKKHLFVWTLNEKYNESKLS